MAALMVLYLPKKRKEFEMWQAKLKTKQEALSEPTANFKKEGDVTLTDGTDFDESTWRTMGVGAGESRRAYFYRTGRQLETTDVAQGPAQPEKKSPGQQRRTPVRKQTKGKVS